MNTMSGEPYRSQAQRHKTSENYQDMFNFLNLRGVDCNLSAIHTLYNLNDRGTTDTKSPHACRRPAVSIGYRKTPTPEVSMPTGRRRSEMSTRKKSGSSGQPPVWQRENLCLFRPPIAIGVSSEEAAVCSGVSHLSESYASEVQVAGLLHSLRDHRDLRPAAA